VQLLLLLRHQQLVVLRSSLHLRIHLRLQRSDPSILLCRDLPLLLRGLLLCGQLALQGSDPRILLCRNLLCYLQRLMVCRTLRIQPGERRKERTERKKE
jgi:hypothetical protein